MMQLWVARSEARKSEKVAEFLGTLLSSAGQTMFDPQKVTVAEMLDRAEPMLEKSWKSDPKIEVQLRLNLASSYLAVQRPAQSKAEAEKALAIAQRIGDRPDQVEAFYWLAMATEGTVQARVTESYFRSAIELASRLGSQVRPNIRFRTRLAYSDFLAFIMQSDYAYALQLADEAVDLARRNPEIPYGAAMAQTFRAEALLALGRTSEAEAAALDAAARFKAEGALTYASAQPYYLLYLINTRSHNFVRASDFARQRYEILLQGYGPNHAKTADAKIMWARMLAETGQVQQGLEIALAAMPTIRKGYPAGSGTLWASLTSLSHILNLASRFPDAEATAREELDILDHNHLPEVDQRRGASLQELGTALRGEGKRKEANAALERSAAIFEGLGPVWASRVRVIRQLITD